MVAPNNDTLYSSGWFDLGVGDVSIDVPPMDRADRYWSVMVIDAYTHVAYASRRLHGTDGCSVRLTLDPSSEWSRSPTSVIPIATPTAWILVRVMVDGPGDVEAARAIQRAIEVRTTRDQSGRPTRPLGAPNRVHEAGAAFFDELADAVASDPPAPWHPRPPLTLEGLATLRDDLPAADLVGAVELGERMIAAHPFANDATGNGWGTRRRGSDFGDDVLHRAAAAKFALAGHHPAENRSYIALRDANGLPLDGTRPLILRFPKDGSPPCDGFWSLTVYGPDLFLVDNAIDRWSIGDRTPGLHRDVDGGLTIVISSDRPRGTSNWLPAPAGPYRLALRVYEGHHGVVAATWFPPALDALESGPARP